MFKPPTFSDHAAPDVAAGTEDLDDLDPILDLVSDELFEILAVAAPELAPFAVTITRDLLERLERQGAAITFVSPLDDA